MRIAGQHVEHIAPLARAQADKLQWAVSCGGEGLAELGLNHRQAVDEAGSLARRTGRATHASRAFRLPYQACSPSVSQPLSPARRPKSIPSLSIAF
jgi:hypothetical protein